MTPARISLLFLLLLPLVILKAEETNKSLLVGTWHLNSELSSELSPWKTYDLTIDVKDDTVTINQNLTWGRRVFNSTLTIDTTKADNIVPISMWPDNRHIGAYSYDHLKHVHATWLENRRILQLSTDLNLQTQQGVHSVNILSDYKVSASGSRLTLTELRSTRNTPLEYVFDRVNADSK
ncbi:MAG: hypothetical protein DVB35_07900 [Verrucomicrobia bacterium]|nr:MAG: hypothetical protein DVB35_07900 [Verrucomicrobiota bacterium]